MNFQANVVALSFAFNGTLLSTPQKVIIPVVLAYLLVVIFLGSMSVSEDQEGGGLGEEFCFCFKVHWEKKVGVVLWYALLLPCAAFYIYEIVEVSNAPHSYVMHSD